MKTADIPFNSLQYHQMAGHFWKNGEITRKIGLMSNMRNLYFKQIDTDNFFPRCYDLSEKHDYEDFIEDFKTNKAISILKRVLSNKNTKSITNEMIKTAIKITQRKIGIILGNYNKDNFPKVSLVSQKEWQIISEEDQEEFNHCMDKLKKRKQFAFAFTETNDLPPIITKEKQRARSVAQLKRIKQKMIPTVDNNIKVISNDDNEKEEEEQKKLLPKIKNILDKLRNHSKNEYQMNGDSNIWIVKPSGLSRGRGISCVSTLSEVIKQIISSPECIIQKYIENPLIIKNRKFDIRQWVLVTNLSPLTVWLFDTPYLRFSAEDYNMNDIHNRYSHLTNNSVNKHCVHFKNDVIPGNMWEIETFNQFLKEQFGNEIDHWKEIQNKIKKIVIYSLMSAKHKICDRKNSHEIFGYDIMVDENLNCYLIEVNSSPAWDYSTEITKKLVKEVSEDLVKVVVDYANASKEDKQSIDTGKFKLIFKGNDLKEIELPNK